MKKILIPLCVLALVCFLSFPMVPKSEAIQPLSYGPPPDEPEVIMLLSQGLLPEKLPTISSSDWLPISSADLLPEPEPAPEPIPVPEPAQVTNSGKAVKPPYPHKTTFPFLFEKQQGGKYNYCPSVIKNGNLYYSFYCTNKDTYDITDSIGFTISEKFPDGSIGYSNEKQVLLHGSSGDADSRHVCDPSVIKGEFRYAGNYYIYLMAYLCCQTSNNQDNDIDITVATNLGGPWTKVTPQVPFVDFHRDYSSNAFQWGVGQPSIMSLDKAGTVLLTYTRGDSKTRALMEVWDLSNIDNPVQLQGPTLISTKGLTNRNGNQDFINNADFMYDNQAQELYMFTEVHPYYGNELKIVADVCRIYKMGTSNVTEGLNSGTWSQVTDISKDNTGFGKNHNGGFVRDFYGHRPEGPLAAVYTAATDSTNFLTALWSYHVRIIEF